MPPKVLVKSDAEDNKILGNKLGHVQSFLSTGSFAVSQALHTTKEIMSNTHDRIVKLGELRDAVNAIPPTDVAGIVKVMTDWMGTTLVTDIETMKQMSSVLERLTFTMSQLDEAAGAKTQGFSPHAMGKTASSSSLAAASQAGPSSVSVVNRKPAAAPMIVPLPGAPPASAPSTPITTPVTASPPAVNTGSAGKVPFSFAKK